jgi:F-type H+-transporting ATPase subunit c
MKRLGIFVAALVAMAPMVMAPAFAFAAEGGAAGGLESGMIAIGAGIAIAVAVLGAGLGQGKAVAAALEAIGRNPSAAGQLTTPLIIGLVFMEALGILAFVVAFLLQGKL